MALGQLMLFLLLGKLSTGHEYYSSTEAMAELFSLDGNLTSWFQRSVGQQVDSSVFAYLQAEAAGGGADPSDPVTAYRLISRLRGKWTYMHRYALQNQSDGFLEYLGVIKEHLPEQQEVDGVAMGLIRLQEIYRLEPQSIMGHGLPGLSPEEAHHVAMVAAEQEKFPVAVQWLLETLRLLEAGQEPVFRNSQDLRLELQQDLRHTARRLNPAPELLQLLDKDPLEMQEVLGRLAEEASFPTSTDYETLCREGSNMSPHRQRALFCRYSTGGGNPRLMYAPVKEEDEWDHPRIVRYHDFLSEQEMDMIKMMAKPELQRSEVARYQETGIVDEMRVSKNTWLFDDEGLARITQRMDNVTGLDMSTSEALQVANYGVGGHFDVHYDAFVVDDEDGERIATILIYLSDVEVGGATVFPEVGAALRPIKGSAVMWFNMLQNGEVDELSLHAGCPVFRGNKWVANKWVRERGQEFRRRCSLNPWE